MSDFVNLNTQDTKREPNQAFSPADTDMVVDPPQDAPTPPPTTPTKTISSPQKRYLVQKILLSLLVILICIGGGIFAGIQLSEHFANQSNHPSDGTAQTPAGAVQTLAQISAVAPKTAPIPTDDKLALAFLKLHNTTSNSCYSPLSVRYALEMLRAGAKGTTRSQIDQLLGKTAAKHYDNIADHLATANSLWVKSGLERAIKPSYTSYLKNNYGAVVKSDSFDTAANLNTWIKDNTLGLLDNVLTDEDVRGLTAALVNVLAIDMDWQNQFEQDMTDGQYFGDVTDAELNSGSDEYLYTTLQGHINTNANSTVSYYYNFADQATVFANDLKDYNGTKLQFVAIMPDNLSAFIENANINDINTLLAGLNLAKPKNNNFLFDFRVYIPKFSIDGGTDTFVQDLKDLGVTDAFSEEKADFSELTDDPFFIDGGVHKTKFDFSEEGIKAAAITAFLGKGSAGGGGPIPSYVDITVSINRPFMYLVRDVESGDIWFAGTVYEPNRWSDDKPAYRPEQ